MKYWLEKTYPSKRKKGDFTSLLLSPTKDARGADIYSNMRKVSIGDVVFHLNQDTNSLIGYSEVADYYDSIYLNDENLLSVNLRNFVQLINPINIDVFLSNSTHQDLLAEVKKEGEVFYQEKNNKYYIKQGGYLTKLDERLVKLFKVNVDNITETPQNLEDEEEFFQEGKVKYRLHRHKERNKKLIKAAKENFKLNNDNKLFCEACGFNFVNTYGAEIGEGFIEAHHTIPISEVTEEHKSAISELVLLCSNCHRMIHRKRPWLSINKLQTLLQK